MTQLSITHNDIVSDDDVKLTPSDEQKLSEIVQTAVSNININLPDEDKKAIEENKKSRQTEDTVAAESNVIPVESNWKDYQLNEDEVKQANELYGDLFKYVSKTAELSVSDGVVSTLSTGIDILDTIMGGGPSVGGLTVIAGLPGTFKSALAGQILGTSQLKYKGKLLCHYLDSESATTTERLMSMGVKYPPIKPYEDVTVEKVFKSIESIIAFKELKNLNKLPAVMVWDSVANTTTDVENSNTSLEINKVIGLRARILSFVLPRYISKMRKYNISMIAINQLRDKIEMGPYAGVADLRWMGDKTMPGGNSLKYNAFHLLMLKLKGDLDSSVYGFNGVRIEAKCIKNKLFSPNIPVTLIFDFERGASNFWTNHEFLKENKMITAASWYTLPGYGKYRAKDAESLYNSDATFKQSFDSLLAKAIKDVLIDRDTNRKKQVAEDAGNVTNNIE